jgi:hypothetical protein
MNHWFLVGRDLMWTVLALLPVFFSYLSGRIDEEEGTTDSTMSIFLVWSAVGLQIFGITLLYNGVIK